MESTLLESRASILRYIRTKVSDPDLAEDVLQDSLLKAFAKAPGLRDEERIVPWFYRIVNNAIIDLYRRRGVASRHVERLAEGTEPTFVPADETAACACLRDVIPTLKPEYAELIEELDLKGGTDAALAERMGITRNNLKVRHHRARTQLRKRLEETCRMCAVHGCLDCTCARSTPTPEG